MNYALWMNYEECRACKEEIMGSLEYTMSEKQRATNSLMNQIKMRLRLFVIVFSLTFHYLCSFVLCTWVYCLLAQFLQQRDGDIISCRHIRYDFQVTQNESCECTYLLRALNLLWAPFTIFFKHAFRIQMYYCPQMRLWLKEAEINEDCGKRILRRKTFKCTFHFFDNCLCHSLKVLREDVS